jgi:acyl-CoA thioesterase-1
MMNRRFSRRLAQVSTGLAVFNVALLVLLTASLCADPKPIRILALGDSLTAGFRLKPGDAFPVQLEKALKAKGHAVEVINAGVSGDTTAAALERFEWAVPDNVDAAIVELGANDALRGIDPAKAHRNLEAILARLRAKGIEILLTGMHAPRNWGEGYVKSFNAMYPELAKAHDALFYPFFLDGVVMRADLNLDDGLHPNAKGVARIVERMLPSVEQLIQRVKSKRAG